MVASSNSQTERRVILVGFDSERVASILVDETVTKLVIFDDTDNVRPKFERVYPIYKDRIDRRRRVALHLYVQSRA